MTVSRTQRLLENIYRVPAVYRAEDFLVTDPLEARALEGPQAERRQVPEKLLLAEDEDGAQLALFLDAAVLDRLADQDPHATLDHANLDDFWTVVEGVSHFMYLTWRAACDRAVSLLELELQAEVDKFICAALLAANQRAGRFPRSLHATLFERCRFDPALDAAESERYRIANRYAGKYCQRLIRRFLKGGVAGGLLGEIRSFYRLGQGDKLRHIDYGLIGAG